MASNATLLALVESAIEALLTGGASSYSIGNRSVTKLDLDQLFKERQLLQQAVDRDSRGSAFTLAKMGRRR